MAKNISLKSAVIREEIDSIWAGLDLRVGVARFNELNKTKAVYRVHAY